MPVVLRVFPSSLALSSPAPAAIPGIVKLGYDSQACSPKGARGLMQLMPDTARRFGVADPDEPVASLQGGARYLRWLLDLFADLPLTLAGYNAGENAVIRYGNTVPPYPETRTYVRRVLEYYRQYRRFCCVNFVNHN